MHKLWLFLSIAKSVVYTVRHLSMNSSIEITPSQSTSIVCNSSSSSSSNLHTPVC